MKTLGEVWTSFFNENEVLLSRHYPGLNLQRFLLEARDYTAKNTNSLVDLSHSQHSLSEKLMRQMQEEFKEGRPFAYLLNRVDFLDSQFYVNENVLIPRPETELLVDLIRGELKGKVERILDIGTGSGVILLALLQEGVGKKGTGVDLSPKALEVAQINARKLRLEDKIFFISGDRLTGIEGIFDLIVSNPPYIKDSSHRSLVQESVHSFEPHKALYLPEDQYDSWFEEFFKQIKQHLNGWFYMEGHELEVEGQAETLKRLGFENVQVLEDLSRQKRFLKAFSNQKTF